jgi:hypothetical protein
MFPDSAWRKSKEEAIDAWNTRALSDPNVVHMNMLRGTIARPSLAQIVHIYGEDAIRAALTPREPSDDLVERVARAIHNADKNADATAETLPSVFEWVRDLRVSQAREAIAAWNRRTTPSPSSEYARSSVPVYKWRAAVKSLWKKHGGRQHGPHVEHYFIEEEAFYRFCDDLAALSAVEEGGVATSADLIALGEKHADAVNDKGGGRSA